MKKVIKDYYSLTKSGLVYGNLITVIGGFALGAADTAGTINFALLIATLVGISFVMAAGCVFNNYIDRDIDARMPRTKDRALVTRKISGRAAIIFGVMLGALGFATFAFFTNLFAAAAATLGFFAYVVLYSLWAKRRTVHGALVGAIAGATPPVVGYAAASGRLDLAALILFVIMIVWQMPHFYAIAIRRTEDYRAAGIPVWPVIRGIRSTKRAMLFYVIAFIIVASLLFMFGYVGSVYLIIALLLGAAWLAFCVRGLWIEDGDVAANKLWAHKMFFLSLIVMLALFVTITFGAVRT